VTDTNVLKLVQPGTFSDLLTDVLRSGEHALLVPIRSRAALLVPSTRLTALRPNLSHTPADVGLAAKPRSIGSTRIGLTGLVSHATDREDRYSPTNRRATEVPADSNQPFDDFKDLPLANPGFLPRSQDRLR
jgi:hypothetical protein